VDDALVIDIVRQSLVVGAKLAGPVLVVTLVIGVVVSLLQTITQIQEATLTFVPKVGAVALLLLLTGSWMMRTLSDWVTQLWSSIPSMV
jgi:flagellar biosynthesis protein FliQ